MFAIDLGLGGGNNFYNSGSYFVFLLLKGFFHELVLNFILCGFLFY